MGEVVDVPGVNDNGGRIVAKVKGREPDPRELKRKRGRGVRREPSLYDKEELRRLYFFDGDFDFKDLGDSGFEFGGKRYTSDGYFLLAIRYDRVQRLQKNSVEIVSRNIDQASERRTESSGVHSQGHPPPHAPLPKFIHLGSRVRVLSGPSTGAIGRVLEGRGALTALVDLEVPKHAQKKTSPIILEIALEGIARVFDIGDWIEVKVGEKKGQTGIVSFIEVETVHAVNPQELYEVRNLTESSLLPLTFRTHVDPSSIVVRRYLRPFIRHGLPSSSSSGSGRSVPRLTRQDFAWKARWEDRNADDG